jgi:ectoine hydroxylase-related dioxygenase (phytanoyl-CoA dioxygenase family)
VTDMKKLAAYFLRVGYARIPEALPESTIASLEKVIDDLFAEPTPPFRVNTEDQVSRIDGIIERDPVFLKTLRGNIILPVLRALLGEDIEVARFRHNQATLNRAGDQVPRLHRDVQQWSRPVLNVFIYLEDATAENGATLVVPGSHELPYYGPQTGEGGGTWADEYPELRYLVGQELPVPMKRGGVLLMNALAFHSVGANHTVETRKSLVFACRSSDDLAHPRMPSHVQIVGKQTFRGNVAHQISGGMKLTTGLNNGT